MCAVPGAWLVTSPPAATVAVAVLSDDQEATAVTFCVVPSDSVAVAVAWLGSPAATEAGVDVTPRKVTTAGPTVTVEAATWLPTVAVTVVWPGPTPWTTPLTSMPATPVFALDQEAEPVTSAVEPSEKVPVTVRAALLPLASDRLAGETVIDWSTALFGVTVTTELDRLAPALAETVAEPAALAETRPRVSTVATDGVSLDHVAEPETSCRLPSESVAVAVSWLDVPLATLTVAGVTASERTTGAVTVSVATPLTPWKVAVIVVVPAAAVTAVPRVTVAAEVLLDDQPA